MSTLAGQIELVILRSIVERKESCREASEQVVALLKRIESSKQYEEDERMGRNI